MRLDVEGSGFFEPMNDRGDWLVDNGDLQNLSNIAWSFGKMGMKGDEFFGAIDRRGEWLVKNGSRQEIVNIGWAIDTLGIDSPMFVDAVERKGDKKGWTRGKGGGWGKVGLPSVNKKMFSAELLWRRVVDWGRGKGHR